MAKGSIVDYLKGQGQDSSYNARKKLAEQHGISIIPEPRHKIRHFSDSYSPDLAEHSPDRQNRRVQQEQRREVLQELPHQPHRQQLHQEPTTISSRGQHIRQAPR